MKWIMPILVLAIVLIAGCTANQLAPGQLAKSSADVKAFLDEYPHATVIASLFSNISIKDECNNPQLPIKDYYKVTVKDPDTNMTLIAYIDADSQKTVCAIKTGGAIQNQTENETETNLTGSARGFGQIWVTNWIYYSNGNLLLNVLNKVGGSIKITNISIANGGYYEIPSGILVDTGKNSGDILAKIMPANIGNTKSNYSITVTVHYEIEGGTFSSTGILTGYRDIQHFSSTSQQDSCIGGALFFMQGSPTYDTTTCVISANIEGQFVTLNNFKIDYESGGFISSGHATTGTSELAPGYTGTVSYDVGSGACLSITSVRVTTNCLNVKTEWVTPTIESTFEGPTARGFGQVQVLNPWILSATNGAMILNLQNRVGGTITVTNISYTLTGDGTGTYSATPICSSGCTSGTNNVNSGDSAVFVTTPATWSGATSGNAYTAIVTIYYTYNTGTFSSTGTLTGTYS